MWWGLEVPGLPIHDNWWQTETGGIMIANTPALDLKPGSMGLPLPGVEAAIVRRDDRGAVQLEAAGLATAADSEQVDLDSMDWLNFLIGLPQRFGVDIPEAAYARLTDLQTIVAYLAARGARPGA